MRANARSFTPSTKTGTIDPEPDQFFSDALLKELVREKEKYRVAKLALEAAQARITCLSAENETLKASKILLEAEMKKNKTRRSIPTIEKPARYPLQECFLYDALARQRQIYETKGYPEDNKQDDRLYDLSLVSATSQEDAIFRNFLDDETVNDTSLESPPPPRQDAVERGARLVDISPLSQQQTSEPKPSPTVAEAIESCHHVLESTVMDQFTTANIDKPPTLRLPAEFVAKYRPAKKTTTILVEELPEEDAPVQNDLQLPSNTTPVMVLEETPEKVVPMKTKILPSGVFANAVRLPVLDTQIKWAMNSLVPAFDNEDQIRHAKESFQQLDTASSYFWQHPVRFLPSPTEKNLYRTVMVDYLSPTATYQDVLEHVRGGALESIELFPPLRGCTEFFTARIVFTYEIPAVTMIMQFQKRLSQGDPIKIKGCTVRFWQVLQPTYPPNKQLENDIFEDGYTRILLLENVEHSGILPKLHLKLVREVQNRSVIKIWRTTDGVPMVEFTSVAAAAGAYRRLKGDREFKDCIFDFDSDYCEDGYESR